jgi:hypothetical protein
MPCRPFCPVQQMGYTNQPSACPPWAWDYRASQFSRYLLERAGISDQDTNARPGDTLRVFLASFKKR